MFHWNEYRPVRGTAQMAWQFGEADERTGEHTRAAMSDDDSGQFDARKLRGQKVNVIVPWAALVVSAGAFITYGVNAQRLETVERESLQSRVELRQADQHNAVQDTQIAVIQQQLATIQGQLSTIIGQLDRDRQERRRP